MIKRTCHELARLLDHRRFVVTCFIVFLGIRIGMLFVPTAPLSSDSAWYVHRAVTLVEHGTYSEGGIPTAYWPVGYPAFLALIFKITGPSLSAAKIANLLLSTGTFWLLYLTTRKMYREESIARGAILLLTVYPNNAAYVPLLLTETLFTFLLLAASCLLLSNKTWTNALLAGLILGLATLVKAQTVLLTPVLAAIAFSENWSVKAISRAVVRACAVLCFSLIVVAPWTIRNYDVFGSFVLVSTNGGSALLYGNNSTIAGDYSRSYADDDPLVKQANFRSGCGGSAHAHPCS